MSSLDDVAEKIEGMSELDQLAKKIDSNVTAIKNSLTQKISIIGDIATKDRLTRSLKELNEAMKHYKTAPIQSQLDLESVAKSCIMRGYNEIGNQIYDIAKSLDDYYTQARK